MPRMPGFAMPYVDDVFRRVGSIGTAGKMGPHNLLRTGRRRAAIGGGAALVAGTVMNRSSGARGLSGRSSGGGVTVTDNRDYGPSTLGARRRKYWDMGGGTGQYPF